MSARWRQAVDQSPLYRTPRGTDHGGAASDRSARQLWAWLAWKSEHRQHSGLVLRWTQHGPAADGLMSRRTAQRALYRLQADGLYVPLVRGSSCGAPGDRRRVTLSSGLLTPVPLVGSNVGPLEHADQRRVVAQMLFAMMMRKRAPISAQSPFAVRLSAWLQGDLNASVEPDQNASVEKPESVSRETRTRQSGALIRQLESTYQLHAPAGLVTQPDSSEELLPRDSDESLALEDSTAHRDRQYLVRDGLAEGERLRAWAQAAGIPWEDTA